MSDHRETVEKSEMVVGDQSASLSSQDRPGQQVTGLSGQRPSVENHALSLTREGEVAGNNERVASIHVQVQDFLGPTASNEAPSDSPTFTRQISTPLESLSQDDLVQKWKTLKEQNEEYEQLIDRWGLMVSRSSEAALGIDNAIRRINEHARRKSTVSDNRQRAESCGTIAGYPIQESTREKGRSMAVPSIGCGKSNSVDRAISTPNLVSQEHETPFDILQKQSSRFLPHQICVLCHEEVSNQTKTYPYTKSILDLFTKKFVDIRPLPNDKYEYNRKDIANCSWNLLCDACKGCTSTLESSFENRLRHTYTEGVTLQSLDHDEALMLRIWTYLALAVNVDLYRVEIDYPAYSRQISEFVNQASEQHELVASSNAPIGKKDDLLLHFEKDENGFGRFPFLFIVDLSACEALPNCRVMIIYGQLPPLGLHWAFVLDRKMTATLRRYFPDIVKRIKQIYSERMVAPKHTTNCRLVVQQLRYLRMYCIVVPVDRHEQNIRMHPY